MKEKLLALKKLLDQTEGHGALLVPIDDLRELIAVVEAVTAPNMLLALSRFQEHVDLLNARISRQIESMNRLLQLAEEARKALREQQ